MHARNRTWPLGSDPAERCRQRTLPVEGGDGSTLSLDFTTGVLDPRLTFTRLSNATFINSSGRVEWANANMYWNTAFEGLSGTNPTLGAGPPATGWSYAFAGSTGNAVFNGDGTVTVTTTGSTANDRRAIQRSSGFLGAGLRIVFSVDVLISSGTLQPGDVLWTGTPNNSAFYVNGSLYTSGSLPVGTAFNLSLAFDSNSSGTSNAFFGIGCSGGIAGSATFSNPRWTMWKGSGTVPYYPNTSATNNSTADYFKSNSYQSPRFDYDPTSIGTPRGLLIEGAANNLLFWSESFATSGAASNWGYNSNTGAVVTTDNPAGGTTAFQFAETANSGPLQQSVTVTNAIHTFSAWFKGSTYNSVTTTQVQFGLHTGGFIAGTASIVSGPGSTSIAGNIVTLSGLSTTQWTRVQFTTSAAISGGAVAILIYPQSTGFEVNRSFYIWGAQVEAGSGASSYIPSGASQGSRAADVCYIANADYGFSTSGGTYYVEWSRGEFATTAGQSCSAINTDYASGRWLGLGTGAAATTTGVGSWSGFINMVSTAVAGRNKAAFNYSSWGASVTGVASANGSSPQTGTLTLGTTPTYLMIGSASASSPYNGAGLRDFLNNTVRRIKYWPTALPNAQLQSITT